MLIQSSHSYSKFLVALRELSPNCKFTAAVLKDQLFTQLIAGCHSWEIQKCLLEEDDTLTLEKVMQIMEAGECVVTNSTVFQRASGSNASVHFVNKHQKNFSTHSTNKQQENPNAKDANSMCFNCGHSGHTTRPPDCPTKGTEGIWCHKKGHQENVFHQKQKVLSEQGSLLGNQPSDGSAKKKLNRIFMPPVDMAPLGPSEWGQHNDSIATPVHSLASGGPGQPFMETISLRNSKGNLCSFTAEADSGSAYATYRSFFISNLTLISFRTAQLDEASTLQL